MIAYNRITEDLIISLPQNEIFVFPSNLSGVHGTGAAKKALDFGAVMGVGTGPCGRTWAIPTKGYTTGRGKNFNAPVLPISIIRHWVDAFIDYSKDDTEHIYNVTPIGCGRAGYTPIQIAPLFEKCININHIKLTESFWKALNLY